MKLWYIKLHWTWISLVSVTVKFLGLHLNVTGVSSLALSSPSPTDFIAGMLDH